ncbi:hypothetical protein PAXRUDRAFT_100561, partial [Paxillus rubicundulus Ve08.2h10]
YKVHIIAWGFTQKEGIDYQEVCAPSGQSLPYYYFFQNLDSIQTHVTLAAKHDLELHQMDV